MGTENASGRSFIRTFCAGPGGVHFFKNAFFFKRNVHLLAPAGSTVRPTETVETFEARVVRSLSRALEHKLEYSYDHFSYFVQGNDDGALEFPFPFALPG